MVTSCGCDSRRPAGRDPDKLRVGAQFVKVAAAGCRSRLAITAEDSTITDRRIVTSRERFTAELGARPRARILLEASTESEWVARQLESLGHEVIVADPNYAPMYANRSRRHVRAELAVRDALVRIRSRRASPRRRAWGQ